MAEILLYGIIGDEWDGLDAKSILLALSQGDGDLDVRINSPGGYVMEGLAIYNALVRAKAVGRKITCHIDGLAASMASVIAMAGDEIVIADNALMMIHNPWDCACGDANELRAAADQLDRIRDQMVGIYAGRTGISAEDLVPMLDAETWLTAAQALDQNFATAIAGASTALACNVQPFGFRKVPESPRVTAMAVARPPRSAAAVAPLVKETTMPEGTQAAGNTTATTETTIVAALTQADVQAAINADRKRAADIRALGAKHKLDAAFIEALASGNDTIEVAREKILDKLAERSDALNIGHTSVQVTADARDKWVDGATAWLLTRSGVAGIVVKAAEARGEKLVINPGEFRGVSCVDLARESLVHAGVKLASRDPKAIVGAAFTARGEGGMQTTGDFTVLLENVMHKTLQAAYAITPDTWSRFCGVGTLTDFRAHPRYLRGTFSALDSLNEAGEFRNKALPDGAKESITGATKGNIVALSRQAIINDDMGVFSGIAVDLGRAAKLSIEKDVFALLALNGGAGPVMGDGFNLFDAGNHKNVAAVAAPPGVTSFDQARIAMASQMDLSGNEFLDIRPQAWLGPLGLGGSVRVIVGAPYDTEVAGKFQVPNKVQALVGDIIDTPRLAGNAWYMFADKGVAPAIEVAFLNGVQEPFLDSEQGWRVDGTEWKVRLDYGVGAINWRCAFRNPGA